MRSRQAILPSIASLKVLISESKSSFCPRIVSQEELPTLPSALVELEIDATEPDIRNQEEPPVFPQGPVTRVRAQKFKRLVDLFIYEMFNKVSSTPTQITFESNIVLLVQQEIKIT